MTKKPFPLRNPEIMGPMLTDIGNLVEKHLGFFPPCFVLIITDGENAQTMFAGDNPADMTRLLIEGSENHRRSRGALQ